jgi:hypothetical protein
MTYSNTAPTNGRRYSRPACYEITKTPSLQLRGADSYSGAAYWGDITETLCPDRSLLYNTAPNITPTPCKIQDTARTNIEPSGNTSSAPNGSGGFFATGPSSPTRGSWSQYGLLASGVIDPNSSAGLPITTDDSGKIVSFGSAGFTTASGTATVGSDSLNIQEQSCQLLFANLSPSADPGNNCGTASLSNAGNLGYNNRIISLPKTNRAIKQDTDAGTVNLDLTALTDTISKEPNFKTTNIYTYQYKSAGSYNLLYITGTVKRGVHLTLYVEGRVQFNSNITYQGGSQAGGNYANLAEIPNLVVYATQDIIAYPDVTQLDGTFVAGNTFSSCDTVFPMANGDARLGESGVCNKQLTINGAVLSRNSPKFARTAGATNTNPEQPAEIINYTPNTFLTPYYLSRGENARGDRYRTVREQTLPARL